MGGVATVEIEIIEGRYSVCKVASLSASDLAAPFCFFARTDTELSLVCPDGRVPANALAREDGWRMLRVAGTLDFSLLGILAHITRVLADASVSVFAASTFDTDYLLVREERFADALTALRRAGYRLPEQPQA